MTEEASIPTDKPRVKATHKIKKKSYGGFYSDFKRYDVRGKSSKDLKSMVEDLKRNIIHQKVRIKKLKAVISLKQEDKVRIKGNAVNKIKSRDKRVTKYEETIESLRKELKSLTSKDTRSEKMINLRDIRIKSMGVEISSLKRKLTFSNERNTKGIKRIKELEKTLKLNTEQARIQRILDRGLNERTISYSDLAIKTGMFLNKHEGLSYNKLMTVIQISVLGSIKTSEMLIASPSILTTLAQDGLVRGERTGKERDPKYWFLTQQGEILVKDYINWLSYSKWIQK